jgi:hypothetical protein
MPIPSNLSLLEPWQALSVDEAAMLTSQLRRELAPGHVLFAIQAKAVAKTANRDDVLFELSDHAKPLAAVHLTWSKKAQADSRWPTVQLFASWDDWVRERLIPDHADYLE